jgi:hypothetical protein
MKEEIIIEKIKALELKENGIIFIQLKEEVNRSIVDELIKAVESSIYPVKVLVYDKTLDIITTEDDKEKIIRKIVKEEINKLLGK